MMKQLLDYECSFSEFILALIIHYNNQQASFTLQMHHALKLYSLTSVSYTEYRSLEL